MPTKSGLRLCMPYVVYCIFQLFPMHKYMQELVGGLGRSKYNVELMWSAMAALAAH